jgi:hypothetical protein
MRNKRIIKLIPGSESNISLQGPMAFDRDTWGEGTGFPVQQ